MKKEINMEKTMKVFLVLNKNGEFGDNDNLRFGRMGAELRRAELMVESFVGGRGIIDYRVVSANLTFKTPKSIV